MLANNIRDADYWNSLFYIYRQGLEAYRCLYLWTRACGLSLLIFMDKGLRLVVVYKYSGYNLLFN